MDKDKKKPLLAKGPFKTSKPDLYDKEKDPFNRKDDPMKVD